MTNKNNTAITTLLSYVNELKNLEADIQKSYKHNKKISKRLHTSNVTTSSIATVGGARTVATALTGVGLPIAVCVGVFSLATRVTSTVLVVVGKRYSKTEKN